MNKVVKQIFNPSALVTVLAVLASFLIGGLLIAFANEDVQATSGYLFARPTDFLSAVWNAVFGAYDALFRGSIFNYKAMDSVGMIKPLTETLTYATPITLAGLGMAVAFRSGLFNIGGTGQIIFGAMGAAWVGFSLELPAIIHLPVAVIAGILASALFGGFVGFLKAATGANEVIVTIMMNYIALNFFTWMLRTDGLLHAATGGGTPKSDPPAESAMLPTLFGDLYKLHIGIFIAVIAAFAYWLLMERSAIGYRFRMVGHNANAARAAGIKVERTFIWAMAVSAAFVGLAAANQGLSEPGGITSSIHADIGFDAITVALLGGSSAPGVLLAGLLFGAFKAGAPSMQVIGISPEVLGIVQGAIVLFIAAPPLIRALFRLPKPQNTNALGALTAKLFKRGGAK